MVSDGTSSKRHSAFLPKIAFQSCVPYRSARPIFFIFFLSSSSPSRSLSIVLIIAISWYPKLLIPRENSRHRQVETDRRETSKCPRTQRRYAIISLTLDSPVRLVSANLIIRDQVRRIPLHLRLFNRTEARRTIERERERRDPVSPGHTDTRGHVRMWVPYIYNLSTYWALRFGGPPRLDLRLFNSSACQKHQCTLCSPIVLPFFLPPTPLSPLPFFLPLFALPLGPPPLRAPFRSFPLFPGLHANPLDAHTALFLPSSPCLSFALCTHATLPPLVYRIPPPGWRND